MQPVGTSLPALLGLGFVLGMRHATDADHVVAVSTIVTRARSVLGASLVGALWGVGHTVTLVLVGGAIVLFRLTLPARVGLSLELLVGIMLVVLGLLNFTSAHHAITTRFGLQHTHDPPGPTDGLRTRLGRAVVVGTVHGLAGSAAVALLVLTTVESPRLAMACILVFGLGTVGGMMAMTSLFAIPLRAAAARLAHVDRYVAWLAGAASLAFGLLIIYRIGFGDGLFTSDPRWTPQ
jgi:high-affinity nickel-transport protein